LVDQTYAAVLDGRVGVFHRFLVNSFVNDDIS
jgi:hypothetical protein